MAGETVKPNLYLPPGISPAIVAKLIIQILECKKLSCKRETSKEILHFALKILMSEDESSLYLDHKFRTITKFSSCPPTNDVATQTRRRKYVSCTIQTESENAIPKKSISLQTEKSGIDVHNKIKRMSTNSTKTVGTQVDFLEFSSVADKENIENIVKLQDDACNEKLLENEEDKILSEKITRKEKVSKKVSRVIYFHGKKLIEKGSKKSPLVIPLIRDEDTELYDPRLKDRDDRECLKLWNSSAMWSVPQKEEPEICVKNLINDCNVETPVKEVNIFPLDFNEDEMSSYSSIITTKNGNGSNSWNKIQRSGDSPEDNYPKLNEITNIDYNEDEEDAKTGILERQKLDPLRFNRRNICKDPRLKPRNCIYNNYAVTAMSKLRRVTITEGMPLESIISSDSQNIRHREECFCNWAPRQACPSDPRIKLRCGNTNLDYRNQKRDSSYSTELPIKKQKLEYDSIENNESHSEKIEEIWTPQSATPEFSPASIESAYDSVKIPQENNLICNLEKSLSFRESPPEAASHKISENDEKHGVKDFQQGCLLFDGKMNHLLKSSNVCDSTEVQHPKLSPERLNSSPISTLSAAPRQNPEILNKNEHSEGKFANSVETNEGFFNKTECSEESNFANSENEENHSILPYKVEFSSNSCNPDITNKELQNEVAKDSSCDKQTTNRSYSKTMDKRESEPLLQKENSPKTISKVSCQKPNTLNCKRDSQDSGISERNVLGSENMEVYSPTDELSMCSDMEVSYTPPVHLTSPDRSPLLDLDSHKSAVDDVEKDAEILPNNFEKLPEYSTKCTELSTISKPQQTNGVSETTQNYSFMKNWVNCMPQWFQQQSLPNYYKWYRDGSELPAMHYQTFYPPYSNNYISDWLTCYSWWNGNAAGWH